MTIAIEEGGFTIHTTHTCVVGLARNNMSLLTTEKMVVELRDLLFNHFHIPDDDLGITVTGYDIIVTCSCERMDIALHYARIIESSAIANGYDLFNHLDSRMEGN